MLSISGGAECRPLHAVIRRSAIIHRRDLESESGISATRPVQQHLCELVCRAQIGEVAGAIYDVGTGKLKWLPDEKPVEILKKVESSPQKEIEPFAAY